jgi:prepilin-type N-terminal cleavage/methylation domain-containing protein
MRPTKTYNNSCGFTLVEMLIVAAMVSIVSLTMYAVFNNGLKIWQRVNSQIPESEVAILFDKLSLDLKNNTGFKGINFTGGRDKLAFATIVNSPALKKRTVGEVAYVYDSGSGTLTRVQKDFSQIYSKEEGTLTQSLANIESLRFQYYFYDKQNKVYLWLDEWSKKGIPLAVRLELGFNNGKETESFTKTVSIPVSG